MVGWRGGVLMLTILFSVVITGIVCLSINDDGVEAGVVVGESIIEVSCGFGC